MGARKSRSARDRKTRAKQARAKPSRKKATRKAASGRRYWSRAVTEHSNALELEEGVFTRSPKEIARSLQRSAERSTRRKSSPFRSAMSMLIFYENRAGRSLPASRRRAIRRAKQELRKLYDRPPR